MLYGGLDPTGQREWDPHSDNDAEQARNEREREHERRMGILRDNLAGELAYNRSMYNERIERLIAEDPLNPEHHPKPGETETEWLERLERSDIHEDNQEGDESAYRRFQEAVDNCLDDPDCAIEHSDEGRLYREIRDAFGVDALGNVAEGLEAELEMMQSILDNAQEELVPGEFEDLRRRIDELLTDIQDAYNEYFASINNSNDETAWQMRTRARRELDNLGE